MEKWITLMNISGAPKPPGCAAPPVSLSARGRGRFSITLIPLINAGQKIIIFEPFN